MHVTENKTLCINTAEIKCTNFILVLEADVHTTLYAKTHVFNIQ